MLLVQSKMPILQGAYDPLSTEEDFRGELEKSLG